MFSKNISIKKRIKENAWRKYAISVWKDVRSPFIYSKFTLDAEPALEAIKKINDNLPEGSRKVTMTHYVGKICAELSNEFPLANSILSGFLGGKVYERADNAVTFLVSHKTESGENLSSVKILDLHKKSLQDLSKELSNRSEKVRKSDGDFKKSLKLIEALPVSAVRFVVGVTYFFLNRMNLWSSLFGLPKDSFGGVIVTSIGSLGAQEAYVPAVPYFQSPIICCIGAVTQTPCVRDGEVVVGTQVCISWTLDHRILDGSTAAQMSKVFRSHFENPSNILQKS